MKHLLTPKEIASIPEGRLLNTLIQEYVFSEHPSRWSNGQQKEIPCHWFEEHPPACAEDDGGYCTADGLPDYSRDISRALSLADAPSLKSKILTTHNQIPGVTVGVRRFWATFFDVPFNDNQYKWMETWAFGETLALAVCRAALLAI